jgi:hypothetical protein
MGGLIRLAIPNFIGSGMSKRNSIINNLRQLDGAKCQWAFEHGVTNEPFPRRVLTQQDLAPYCSRTRGSDWRNSKYGELYLIRDLDQPCEAVLTEELKERDGNSNLPRGSIIRLTFEANGFCEVISPDGTATVYGYGLPNGRAIITNR